MMILLIIMSIFANLQLAYSCDQINPTAMELSIDGKNLFIGDLDGFFYQCDLENNKISKKIKVHSEKITSILASEDNQSVFIGSFDKSIAIVNLKDIATLRFLNGHNGAITSLVHLPNKNLLISGSSDRTVKVWDVKNQLLLKTIDKINSVITSITTDGNSLFIGTSEGIVYIVALYDDDSKIDHINLHESVVSSLSFIKEKSYLVSSSWDRSIAIWDIKKNSLIRRCMGHGYWVTSVAIFDNKLLSAGSLDYTLRLWNLDDCKEILTIKGLNSYVVKAIFSRDGKYIFSLTLNEGIKIWDTNTGKQISQK